MDSSRDTAHRLVVVDADPPRRPRLSPRWKAGRANEVLERPDALRSVPFDIALTRAWIALTRAWIERDTARAERDAAEADRDALEAARDAALAAAETAQEDVAFLREQLRSTRAYLTDLVEAQLADERQERAALMQEIVLLNEELQYRSREDTVRPALEKRAARVAEGESLTPSPLPPVWRNEGHRVTSERGPACSGR